MRWPQTWWGVVALALMLAGCGSSSTRLEDGHQHLRPHYQGSRFQLSEHRLYSVELLLPAGPLKVGANRLDMIIHQAVAHKPDLEGATVRVRPWLPVLQQGVPTEPRVIERGGGLYSVENLAITRGGDWQLRIMINGPAGGDEALFVFPGLEEPSLAGNPGHRHAGMHGGRNGSGAAAGGVDFATTRRSASGRYTVSYQSLVQPVPLNRLHSWRLSVRDPAGRPVAGLRIKVTGGMPTHGHGLPTRPQVTGEAAAGVYLVEGLRFNMPGWWRLDFLLAGQQGEERVRFNLRVR